MPAGLAKLVGSKGVNWDYNTAPDPNLGNRSLWWPRGKVLGGSSSINAMCYIRGHARDYDEWEALGAAGWNWANVLPYFKRSEGNTRGASEFHGGDGPLGVSDLRHDNPLSPVFIEAAREAGLAATEDFNGAHQEGFGWYQMTHAQGRAQFQRRGLPQAGALARQPDRGHRATANRITFEDGRADGVVYAVAGKGAYHEQAAREVLLCGGAINSPQLLMLSGIGPAAHLRPARHPAGVRLARRRRQPAGSPRRLHDAALHAAGHLRPTSDVLVGLQYYLFKQGPGTSNIAETGGFARSPLAEDERPDLQFHFVPAHARRPRPQPPAGRRLHPARLLPAPAQSRPPVRWPAPTPATRCASKPGYLSDAEGFDLKVMVEAVRMSRRIFAQDAFAPYPRRRTVSPAQSAQSDEQIVDFIRRKAESIYHPVGTCRMGAADDGNAVVDPQLRVRGVSGLRVVDASVMPKLIGGNTNAPTMMIAERAADLILGKA